MEKIWNTLQIWAIEILKIQKSFIDRSGDVPNLINITAILILIMLIMTAPTLWMLARLIYTRSRRLKMTQFYGDPVSNIVKKDIQDVLLFLLEAVGFIITLIIIFEHTLYHRFYTLFYLNTEYFTQEQLLEGLLKTGAIWILSFFFTVFFPIIAQRILHGEITKLKRMAYEYIFLCSVVIIGILLLKLRSISYIMFIRYFIWVMTFMSIYMIWHRVYFLCRDYIKNKRKQFQEKHIKKEGIVK